MRRELIFDSRIAQPDDQFHAILLADPWLLARDPSLRSG
jgi:hypothetical protein